MKIKKEYVILILLIAALSAYLLMRSTDRTHYQLPGLSDLVPGKITKIEISRAGDTIILKKSDNQWYLEPMGYLVDTNQVNGVLAVFETLSLAAMVSESKDYQRYDLHPAKRITAKAWQEDTLMRNLDIGKAAPSFRHTFVKLGDDSRVFHATDNFRGKFEKTPDNLRDRSVLSFKTTDIQAVELTKDKASAELLRSEVPVKPSISQPEKAETAPPAAVKYAWQDRTGKKANDQNLNRLLTILGSLKCARYIEDRNKDSFSEPIYTVKLKGIRQHQLDIFAKLQKDAENYPAVSSGNDYPFLLSDSQAQQIMKDPNEFVQKEGDNKEQAEKK